MVMMETDAARSIEIIEFSINDKLLILEYILMNASDNDKQNKSVLI